MAYRARVTVPPDGAAIKVRVAGVLYELAPGDSVSPHSPTATATLVAKGAVEVAASTEVDLDSLSMSELQALAKRADLAGRSTMTKAELIAGLSFEED